MEQRGFQSFLRSGKFLTSGDNHLSPTHLSDNTPYPYISSYDFFNPENPPSQTFKKPKQIHLPPPSIMFTHLPPLQSLEPVNYFTPPPPPPPPPTLSSLEKARKRRNTLSDKTRSLQKILPFEKKMDMATILEETIKYVKFLQAQVTVLESMPRNTHIASNTGSNFVSENDENEKKSIMYGNSIVHGELAKLSRQQLLEVVVNSPGAQSSMYSKGCCIYSLEQLVLFKDIAEQNFFLSHPSISLN